MDIHLYWLGDVIVQGLAIMKGVCVYVSVCLFR